jgi:hypothetical protein
MIPTESKTFQILIDEFFFYFCYQFELINGRGGYSPKPKGFIRPQFGSLFQIYRVVIPFCYEIFINGDI